MNTIAKAITGAILAGLAALQVALLPDPNNVVEITQLEWVVVASAVVTALGLVWGVPNSPAAQQNVVPVKQTASPETDGN